MVAVPFQAMAFLFYLFSLPLFGIFVNGNPSTNSSSSSAIFCPFYKSAPSLDLKDLVGSWMTVYTQPRTVNCFILHIKATTELEREQALMRYSNFSGRVDWSRCYLEVESPLGKHYLQGGGSEGGLLENIIVSEVKEGGYTVQEQSADQWMEFGERGRELLLMRDCTGEAAAVFARAPYWPSADELFSILHRGGVAPSHGRVLCQPLDLPSQQCSFSTYFANKNH